MLRLNCKRKNILIIPDAHSPYSHPDAFKFLKAIKKKYLDKNSVIINLGDEVDGHCLSFHSTDEDLLSGGDELKAAIKELKELEKIFPKMYLCDSNHGSLIYRRAKADGIPLHYLKSLNEVYGVSNKWSWHEEIVCDTLLGPIYFCHGKSATYGKLCKEVGMSACQGHYHGKAEITWHKTVTSERFNMFCGCLIDRDSLAFAYGKNHLPKPILGAGLISKHGFPRFIKMQLNEKDRWDGHLP